jgi:hypothetical protein
MSRATRLPSPAAAGEGLGVRAGSGPADDASGSPLATEYHEAAVTP